MVRIPFFQEWAGRSASARVGALLRIASRAKKITKIPPAKERKPRSGGEVESVEANSTATTIIGASVINGASAILQPSREPCRRL